jgi:hypothetical protein
MKHGGLKDCGASWSFIVPSIVDTLSSTWTYARIDRSRAAGKEKKDMDVLCGSTREYRKEERLLLAQGYTGRETFHTLQKARVENILEALATKKRLSRTQGDSTCMTHQ